jgi:hypothetical protein
MDRDKCPFRDTSQDWATRRRCISTKAETGIDTEEIMSANNYYTHRADIGWLWQNVGRQIKNLWNVIAKKCKCILRSVITAC